MMPSNRGLLLSGTLLLCAACAWAGDQVKVEGGVLEGTMTADQSARLFAGVPYAAAPVGALRWAAPQPVSPWSGVRQASDFGARCYQGSIFNDMIFRDQGMAEDCLYLNIWTPKTGSKLPVLVYFHGGGFAAGSGDEPRYDGTNFARLGVITVTVNYRLGVFGFLAHPEMTAESSHKASGNYGLLDMVASLQWVKRNIAAFGGDPGRVTIGGESAGSFAVSALMASPLAQGLFEGAIGESGAMFTRGSGTLAPPTLAKAEETGTKFADAVGAKSLAELRAKPADEILKASMKGGAIRYSPIIDGYFLPAEPAQIFAKGEQSHVPLLAGWNADEVRMGTLAAKQKPTAASFTEQLRSRFGARAVIAEKLYPARTDEEAIQSAGDLASDMFIDYCTWKWMEAQSATGQAAVFRYVFDRPVPLPEGAPAVGVKGLAGHSWELEYVFGALDSKKADWQPEDRKTSEEMAGYWANFVKTGDPSGSGLAPWPDFRKTHEVMHLDAQSHATPEQNRERYRFLDSYYDSQSTK
jgi:para-nitrobenzyl esterase